MNQQDQPLKPGTKQCGHCRHFLPVKWRGGICKINHAPTRANSWCRRRPVRWEEKT